MGDLAKKIGEMIKPPAIPPIRTPDAQRRLREDVQRLADMIGRTDAALIELAEQVDRLGASAEVDAPSIADDTDSG